MRVPSILSNATRRAPQQERSTQRLANFLEAAARLFVEVGYEGTTMTAVAERTGASIGTLYHYFPDKKSIALALLNQYALELEERWKPLIDQTKTLSHEEFADLFIECAAEMVEKRPAYLKLITSPIRFSRDPAARKALRIALTNAFRAKNPSLSNEKALVSANVILQMIRSMAELFHDAGPKQKPLVTTEFKKIFTLYLAAILSRD